MGGSLELVVSGRLLGQFRWKKCPRFFSAAETDSGGTEFWSLLMVLVLESAELWRLSWTVRGSEPSGGAGDETDFDGVESESSDGIGAVDLSGAQSVPGAVPWEGGPSRCDPHVRSAGGCWRVLFVCACGFGLLCGEQWSWAAMACCCTTCTCCSSGFCSA